MAQILRWLRRWRLWTKNVAASARIPYINNTIIFFVTTTTVSAIICYLLAVSTFSPSITLHFVLSYFIQGILQTTLVTEPSGGNRLAREISPIILPSIHTYSSSYRSSYRFHTLTAVRDLSQCRQWAFKAWYINFISRTCFDNIDLKVRLFSL